MDYSAILPDIQKIIQKHAHLLRSSPELLEIFPSKSIFPAYRRTKNLKDILAPSKFCGNRGVDQAESETRGCFNALLDAIFVRIFWFKILSLKAFPTAARTGLIKICLAHPKMLFSWPLVINVICSTWVLRPRNLKHVFAITSRPCSQTKKRVSLQSISIVPNTWFLKLVLLLLRKLLARGMQLILINCYSQEKPIGPLNCAHLILTVSTKDANLDLKIASAIILN